MTQNRHKYDNTHLWYREELPIYVKCGATPISLGQWGDAAWKRTHNDWKKPCPIMDKMNFKYPNLFLQLDISDICKYLKHKYCLNGENNDSK